MRYGRNKIILINMSRSECNKNGSKRKRMLTPCNNPIPTSGFSRTTAGLSCAELTNAENSLLAPAIMDRSVIVAMLIITNNGKRYVGRVDEEAGSLNDNSKHWK